MEIHVHEEIPEVENGDAEISSSEHPHEGCVQCEEEKRERERMEQSERDRLENIRQGNEYMFAEVANRLDRLDEKVTGTLMLQAADISADEAREEDSLPEEISPEESEVEEIPEETSEEPEHEPEHEPEVIKVESTAPKKQRKESKARGSHRWGK